MGDSLTSVSMCPRKCARKKTSQGYFLKIKLSHTFSSQHVSDDRQNWRTLFGIFCSKTAGNSVYRGWVLPRPSLGRPTFQRTAEHFWQRKTHHGSSKTVWNLWNVFFFEGGWISHYTYFFSINSLRVILCHVDHSAERFTGSLDPLTFCEDNLFLQGFFIWQLLPNHLSWSLGSQRSPKTSISSCRCQSWGICTMLRFGCFGPHMVLCYMSRHDWTPGWLVTWYWTGTRKN